MTKLSISSNSSSVERISRADSMCSANVAGLSDVLNASGGISRFVLPVWFSLDSVAAANDSKPPCRVLLGLPGLAMDAEETVAGGVTLVMVDVSADSRLEALRDALGLVRGAG